MTLLLARELDVRIPIGGLLAVLGALLAAYGVVVHPGITDTGAIVRSNVDLWWGVAMLGFGALFILLAVVARDERAEPSSTDDAAGERRHGHP